MRLHNRPDIVAVKAILDSGEEIILEQKPLGNTGQPSQSTFFGRLKDGSFTITLRIDWNDLDNITGDPKLDADIFNDGKKYLTERKKWHHTQRAFDDGEWVYKFEFGNIKLRFKLGITSQHDQTAKSRIASAPPTFFYQVIEERLIFCEHCQQDTNHTLAVDSNKEIVATCGCGHFIKFPESRPGEKLDALIADHKKHNQR